MRRDVSRIISASAGTGKTYRLSLEYLALILSYYSEPEFQPDQILVITFTRKATAEIRDRIYLHLNTLGNHLDGWEDLARNLKAIMQISLGETEAPLTDSETTLLRDAYHHLITHRDQLQVMTIDSYIHSIFRNLIRPVRGIDRFELDLKAIDKRLPHLMAELMTPALRLRLQKLLSGRLQPSLDEYQNFFRALINQRWLYYLSGIRSVDPFADTLAWHLSHPETWEEQAARYYKEFMQWMQTIITSFSQLTQARYGTDDVQSLLREGVLSKKFIAPFVPKPASLNDLYSSLSGFMQEERFTLQMLSLLADDVYIWSGTKIKTSKANPFLPEWKEWHANALHSLANYLIFRLFLPEQAAILNIWKDVLHHYDQLIYRYKNFTYDDIAWFTFEALYSSEPPLFAAEPESIANEFYDFLSRRTRFMLIDEFQDTSILQFNILAPMIEEIISGEGSKPYGGLIVVGDEKQSIFGWRGGQRDLLLTLDTIFHSLRDKPKAALTDSWRSSSTLMDFVNAVFAHNILTDFLTDMQADWSYSHVQGRKTELDDDTVIRFQMRNYSPNTPGLSRNDALRCFVEETVIPALLRDAGTNRTHAILARKNDELEAIRSLLAEHGIASEFQSSKSLLDHPVLKALLQLLRFAVYRDWYDFLAFLRSDLILLGGKELKTVIKAISACYVKGEREACELCFTSVPIAQEVLELADRLDTDNLYRSCLTILESCAIHEKLTLERDFVNIQRFLDIVLEYEEASQPDLPGLQGLLRYCEDNRTQPLFQQMDLERSKAVQLLTIHTSKGLEFDSVFIWWNLRSSSSREDKGLHSWVQYSDTRYHKLSDIALSMHYASVLENSSFSGITRSEILRASLEELNILYVALTRARSRLYLFVAYPKKNGWTDYYETYRKEGKLTPPHVAIASILDYFQTNHTPLSDYLWQIGGEIAPLPFAEDEETLPEDTPTPSPLPNMKHILPDWRTDFALPQDEETEPDTRNFKQSYLIDRDNLKGDIAHHFLSHIMHATADEIARARIFTLRRYGNLLPLVQLEALLSSLEKQLPIYKHLFHPDYDLVYNEYPVYYKDREYRIDRLMINTRSKTYRLIDYKTGGVHEPDQLSLYASIVKSLFEKHGYSPECEPAYVKLEV